MFETAELGQTVSKEEFHAQTPELRERLLEAQLRLLTADFPVVVLFAGVDGAGKGEMTNLLNEWLDPRGIATRAYSRPSEEEGERPEFWRFWRDLPPRGHISVVLSAWYSMPLLQRAFGETDVAALDHQLEKIQVFERMLVDDGALIVKFWMHLGKVQQKERLAALEADPLQNWRVTKRDWKHYKMYDKFVSAAERIIMRTSTGEAPWTLVEGMDRRYRTLKVSTTLLAEVERRLAQGPRPQPAPIVVSSSGSGEEMIPRLEVTRDTILSQIDLSQSMPKKEYASELQRLQARLNALHRKAADRKISTILLLEGWDAAGKGGAIRRITGALEARLYQVISTGPPTDEEQARHYLWRFWRHLPRAGRFTIYDRTWYGRVLVERVERFATESEWRRAYAEINYFEQELVDHGDVLVKFWLHISRAEQERRFKAREETSYKRWKLTDDDWRNRDRWPDYERAVDDMVERTSTEGVPWHLVAGDDKRHARIKLLSIICDKLENRLDTKD